MLAVGVKRGRHLFLWFDKKEGCVGERGPRLAAPFATICPNILAGRGFNAQPRQMGQELLHREGDPVGLAAGL